VLDAQVLALVVVVDVVVGGAALPIVDDLREVEVHRPRPGGSAE